MPSTPVGSCRCPDTSRNASGTLMASCQGVAEICTRLARSMAGAAMLELGSSWKAVPAPLRVHSAPAELTLCPGLCWYHSVLLWLDPALQEGHVRVSAPEPGPFCLVGVRPEAAELCCDLGSPAPGVPPSTPSHGNA